VDAAVKELAAAARDWAATPYKERAALARACAQRAASIAEDAAATAVAYKGSYEARRAPRALLAPADTRRL
jgi:acyl-CoA reductase-like NAD-dependent aldehyde dehydrogenase